MTKGIFHCFMFVKDVDYARSYQSFAMFSASDETSVIGIERGILKHRLMLNH